jgi:hypothetical protein
MRETKDQQMETQENIRVLMLNNESKKLGVCFAVRLTALAPQQEDLKNVC